MSSCVTCGVSKPASEFPPRPDSVLGHRRRCKACQVVAVKRCRHSQILRQSRVVEAARRVVRHAEMSDAMREDLRQLRVVLEDLERRG